MKGETMNLTPQSDQAQEVSLQAPEIKVPDDRYLPAAQVIAEQSQDVKEHLTPRFVP